MPQPNDEEHLPVLKRLSGGEPITIDSTKKTKLSKALDLLYRHRFCDSEQMKNLLTYQITTEGKHYLERNSKVVSE